MAHDEPARQCFTWHLLGKLPDPVHRKRDDGSLDPYSVRFCCPGHDDNKASAGISVVNDQVKYNCFVCSRQKFRLALHREYDIDLACLPLAAAEKQDALDYLADLLAAETSSHAEIRLRALAAIEGYRGLPRGYELERLARLTSVSRGKAYSFRSRPDPAKTANPSSYTESGKAVKQPRSGAQRKVPSGDKVPPGDTKKSPQGTRTARHKPDR